MVLIAEPFILIAHPDTPPVQLTHDEAQAIFLKKRRFLGETSLTPLNLPPSHPLRLHVEETLLGMNPHGLDRYWMELHYKGVRPPYRVESLESMVMFVRKVKGAIGYLPKSHPHEGVRVVYEEAKR